MLRRQIQEINREVEQMLIELDSSAFNLTEFEDQRIQNAETIERATERIKPFMLLSLMMESPVSTTSKPEFYLDESLD